MFLSDISLFLVLERTFVWVVIQTQDTKRFVGSLVCFAAADKVVFEMKQ